MTQIGLPPNTGTVSPDVPTMMAEFADNNNRAITAQNARDLIATFYYHALQGTATGISSGFPTNPHNVTAAQTGLTVQGAVPDASNNIYINGSGITVSGTGSTITLTNTQVGGGGTWGSITGTLSSQLDLEAALSALVPYTGAINGVNLNTQSITAASFNGGSGVPLKLIPSAGEPIQVSTTGNTRGNNAVDLQASRSLATQVASGTYSVIGGGYENIASAEAATVSGGYDNQATDTFTTVSGGENNEATAQYATVGGGNSNQAMNLYATIGGGNSNAASGTTSTISGGNSNQATNSYATVGGGQGNTVSGVAAMVGGGASNQSTNNYSMVGGGYNNQATGISASIGGGWGNTSSASYSTIGGGATNQSTNTETVVSGGYGNTSSGVSSMVGGGYSNLSSGTESVVAGGYSNQATNSYTAIGGGVTNQATGLYATVAGGRFNTATATSATVAGGSYNAATKVASCIPGGYQAGTNYTGGMAYAHGCFDTPGDAQTTVCVAKAVTTNNTGTPLLLNGGYLTVPDNFNVAYDITIVAKRVDAQYEGAGWKFVGVFENAGNACEFIGTSGGAGNANDTAHKTVLANDNSGAWDVSLTVGSNDDILITATGQNSKTIYWVARVELTEVGNYTGLVSS